MAYNEPQPAAPMVRLHRRVMLLWLITLLLLGGWFLWREVWPALQGPAGEPRTVSPRAELNQLERTNIRIFQNASPSVVHINTRARQVNPWTRRVYDRPLGTGSGFVWDERGHVITNFHVIRNATSAQVVMHDHRRFNAQLIGVMPGDVIQKIDERDVTNANDLLLALDHFDLGDTVTLTLWRDGDQVDVDVTLKDWSPGSP